MLLQKQSLWHNCRGKIMFPSLSAFTAARGDGSLDQGISSSFQPCSSAAGGSKICSTKFSVCNVPPNTIWWLGQLDCAVVHITLSSLLAQKVKLEQVWISLPLDFQLQYRNSQRLENSEQSNGTYYLLKPHHFYKLQPVLWGAWFLHLWVCEPGIAGTAKACSC